MPWIILTPLKLFIIISYKNITEVFQFLYFLGIPNWLKNIYNEVFRNNFGVKNTKEN